jgi:hypothetical protein
MAFCALSIHFGSERESFYEMKSCSSIQEVKPANKKSSFDDHR